VNNNDERDYAEEAANKAEMEQEQLEETIGEIGLKLGVPAESISFFLADVKTAAWKYRAGTPLFRRVDEPDKCNCEHTSHFSDEFGPQTAHTYLSVNADNFRALHVGPICYRCAHSCMKDYLL